MYMYFKSLGTVLEGRGRIKERRKEGGREGGRKGKKEREEGRERGKEGGREEERDRREGGREGHKLDKAYAVHLCTHWGSQSPVHSTSS